VYVPNTLSNTVTVIDPATYKVIDTIPVGDEPQHVVPSWDLKTLWVNNDLGNTLTPIDPATGKAGPDRRRARPVQPLLHAGRQVRGRDGLGRPPAGLP
jgi:YVTN family beta-propeller protein